MAIKALLFDISGVLYQGDTAIVGAVETLNSLQQRSIPFRLVTNTSQSTRQDIHTKLLAMNFSVDIQHIFTAPSAVKAFCIKNQLRPYCLIHPNLETEFADLDQSNPNAVFIADAAERFDYPHLNTAFSILMQGATLIGIGRNRYFKSATRLALDAGPFISALEIAADVEATILGKPASGFFQAAVADMNCKPEDVLMIGDDVDADVMGALNAGLQACLVKTGKYLAGDEHKAAHAMLATSVLEAVNDLFS